MYQFLIFKKFYSINVHTIGPSLTPQKMAHDPFGGHDLQFGNHCSRHYINLQKQCEDYLTAFHLKLKDALNREAYQPPRPLLEIPTD